jgi:hypothetical protein
MYMSTGLDAWERRYESWDLATHTRRLVSPLCSESMYLYNGRKMKEYMTT